MPSQAFALRDIRLSDLPALKRWRSLPEVQQHLRHPTPPKWGDHLRWWWRTRRDPTCYVRSVTRNRKLVGVVGCYYIAHGAGELSMLCTDGTHERYDWNLAAMRLLLQEVPVLHVWAEVYPTAPALRGQLFCDLGLTRVPVIPSWVQRSPTRSAVEGAAFYWSTLPEKSTIYRWSLV